MGVAFKSDGDQSRESIVAKKYYRAALEASHQCDNVLKSSSNLLGNGQSNVVINRLNRLLP